MKIKCKNYDPKFEPFNYVQGKRDGIYLRIEKGKAYTSLGADITEKVKYLDWFQNVSKCGYDMVGELFAKNKPASEVKHRLVTKESLEFNCFALVNNTIVDQLEHVQNICVERNIKYTPFINLCAYRTRNADIVHHPSKMFEIFLDIQSDKDYEGLVYKNGNLLDWYKWKPVKTIDCVVVGSVDGKGKFDGLIGSLMVGIYHNNQLYDLANVGGFDDDTRAEITNSIHLNYKVIEVKYQYIGSKGGLRHPNFVRFRDDKLAKECTTDQDQQLLEYYNNLGTKK